MIPLGARPDSFHSTSTRSAATPPAPSPGVHPPFTRTKQVGAGLRLGLADGERRYGHYEKQLAARPFVEAPTLTPDAEHDPFTAPDVDADRLRDRHSVRHRLDR
ncbi:hypothetical protein ACIO87_33035 [Streptomyces sp. NPDC087218]|uniref:hypothetical protein n=1 Tax=Streptomyces sp. NPDC087218 TaxID=3365769 RepID=UPI003814671E